MMHQQRHRMHSVLLVEISSYAVPMPNRAYISDVKNVIAVALLQLLNMKYVMQPEYRQDILHTCAYNSVRLKLVRDRSCITVHRFHKFSCTDRYRMQCSINITDIELQLTFTRSSIRAP
jgi:hypothetical protein